MNHIVDSSMYFYEDNPISELPDIHHLFQFYNEFFFEKMMESSTLKWSKRMTLCAGTCCMDIPGSCTITLSEPLLKFRSNNEIKETLLHEMIHGYLFITNPKACISEGGHGQEF
jgi:hypothetical protein